MLKKKIRPKPVKNKNSLAPMVPAAFEICHDAQLGWYACMSRVNPRGFLVFVYLHDNLTWRGAGVWPPNRGPFRSTCWHATRGALEITLNNWFANLAAEAAKADRSCKILRRG